MCQCKNSTRTLDVLVAALSLMMLGYQTLMNHSYAFQRPQAPSTSISGQVFLDESNQLKAYISQVQGSGSAALSLEGALSLCILPAYSIMIQTSASHKVNVQIFPLIYKTIGKQVSRIIILEGIYTAEEVNENHDRLDMFVEELELELRGEIEASIGPIERMQFFPENPTNGYVKIKFESALHADECIKTMEGRFFDGRQLKAYFWDGKSDYRILRETTEDLNRRIDDFGAWLEQQEIEGEGQVPNEAKVQENEPEAF